jgi:DNA-binding transcriptional MerR regulator
MYTVSQVSKALGKSISTIQKIWTVEYAEFLSSKATPGKGKTRLYSDEDLAIFQTIALLRDQQMPHKQVKERLAEGERLEPPEGPVSPARPDAQAVSPSAQAPAEPGLAYDQGVDSLIDRIVDAEKRFAIAELKVETLQAELNRLKGVEEPTVTDEAEPALEPQPSTDVVRLRRGFFSRIWHAWAYIVYPDRPPN